MYNCNWRLIIEIHSQSKIILHIAWDIASSIAGTTKFNGELWMVSSEYKRFEHTKWLNNLLCMHVYACMHVCMHVCQHVCIYACAMPSKKGSFISFKVYQIFSS